MNGGRVLALAPALALTALACGARPTPTRSLLEASTLEGRRARASYVSLEGDSRPALVESARYRLRAPERALLTFSMGAPRGTAGPAPELRLTVRVDGRSVFRHGLAAGALGRWNDFSVAFDGAAGEMTLELDLKSRGGAGLRCRRWPSRRSTTWTATDAPEACC